MIHPGSCHCGAIAFEVDADITEAIDCNCSMCRRRGGLLAFVSDEQFTLKTPASAVSTYEFNKHALQHHFCRVCGIAPYSNGQGRTGPMVAVNVRCLPDIDLENLTMNKVDGKQF